MFGYAGFGMEQAACGTETMREMIRWFPMAMRDVLADFGFGISTYIVPVDAVTRADGAMQVLFDRSLGTRQHRIFDPRHERSIHRKHLRAAEPWAICPAPIARAA